MLPLALAAVAYSPANDAAPSAPRVEISPGVYMPLMNFGSQPDHKVAIKLGARGLDSALTYGDAQQSEVGAAVRASGVPRSEFFVTTKVPCWPSCDFLNQTGSKCPDRHSQIAADVAHDLDVLGLDYVDLMLLHWPCDTREDTVASYLQLEQYALSGKARAIGVSNFNASQLEYLLPRVHIKPVLNQCGYSIAGHTRSYWGRDDETRAYCDAAGITYAAYSPLGGVALGGAGYVLKHPTVRAVAAAHNRSTAQACTGRWEREGLRREHSGARVCAAAHSHACAARRWRYAGWCSRACPR